MFWDSGRAIHPRKAFTTFPWRGLFKTSSAQIFNRGDIQLRLRTIEQTTF